MEWTDIQQNWSALTASILTRWPEADEAEVQAIEGDRPAFVAYISRLEDLPDLVAEERVLAWAETAMPADARMDPTADAEAFLAAEDALPPGEEPLDADEAFGDEGAPDQPLRPTD